VTRNKQRNFKFHPKEIICIEGVFEQGYEGNNSKQNRESNEGLENIS
jgi:hypothetical protein